MPRLEHLDPGTELLVELSAEPLVLVAVQNGSSSDSFNQKLAIETTIDSAGRVVLPKAVRDQAGILPG
jgi:DNA-binding transcriptional regulator/RsmH inhibitor MraZ